MIIFKGNDKFAYRDPACFLFEDTYFLFFTVSEIAFILYAIVYLLLGLAAMAVTALIKKFIR